MRNYGQDRGWPFAQGGGVTIGLVTLLWLTAVGVWNRFTDWIAGILLFLTSGIWLITLYFFRDPNREVVNEPGLVVGPGDGEVVAIMHERETRYLHADSVRVSIFLSLMDVHVQRVPLGGTVTLVEHQPGKFLQAFRPEASEVNEYIAMCIETEYGRILIKQIAGILARRCVNYLSPGTQISTGQRFGLIRFGSRLDLFLPPDAELLIETGDRIEGGTTPIARLHRRQHAGGDR